MEVEHVSSRKKYEAIINVNISDLEKHYDRYHLNYKNDSNILTEDANCYHLSITVEDDTSGAEYWDWDIRELRRYDKAMFGIQVDWVSELKFEADLEVTFTTMQGRTKTVRFQTYGFEEMETNNSIKYCLLRNVNHSEKKKYMSFHIKSIKGKVTLKFIPETGMILKERLVKNFSKLMEPIPSMEKSDEFELHCQNEVVIFHKPLLKKISDAFKNMLDNSNFKETQNGIMTIKETLPETIKAFKRIFYDKIIEEKDLNVDLMLFANQYDIKPLVDLCTDHLGKSFTKDNIIEIVDAAFKTDDEELLKKAIHFIQLNVEDFQKDITWKDYMKSNPDCSAKIMFMLMKS